MKKLLSILGLIVSFIALTGMSVFDSDKAEQKQKHHHATVKPHANVHIQYKLAKNYSQGIEHELEIIIINGYAVDDLIVRYQYDEGLIALEDVQNLSLGSLDSRSRNKLTVKFMPQHEGLMYINFFVTLVVNDDKQTRSFAIPVQVGEYHQKLKTKHSGDVKTDEQGQKIISMPAKETSN